MRQDGIIVIAVLVFCCWRVSAKRKIEDDYDDEERPVFNYNRYLQFPYAMKADSKSKVERLGSVLKGHIHKLKNTKNKEFDIVFLVDSSTSVGKNNFKEEIKFVKKLLSDFTVDVNHTRVSVITFSSRNRVIRHVDYLDDTSKDRHKCSLLERDLKGITYSGGGTFTLGAFREAREVFKNARPTANKAIFLVTDGFSNGGDPSGEARTFRRQGVKIFTFGIKNGNIVELLEMASKPKNESCYILDSFEEFEALAKRALHEDLYSGRYIEQPSKRCDRLCVGKDCCDPLATCNCGTHTGQYECICPPGYFGNGLRGGCQACPSGTYKPDMKPGDDFTCRKCPDEKHITEPGATSPEQCTCQKGYRTFNGTGCAVLKCPVLPIPKNGYFVNDKCKNVFNAACGLRCKPGYDLRGSSLRICREDGNWSGIETECIMKTCPALMKPKNGNMICTTDDFTFNTVCRFTCDTGYKLVGSRKRTCLAIAFWTGINTRCREITCRPLPVVRDGSIHPPACTAGDVTFGTTCSITCSPGYTLNGPHSKQCLPEGVWTPASEVNECVDTSAPFIMCPYNIEVEADENENSGTVSWQVPLAVDNSGYVPVLTSVPVVLPPAQFPIGRTKVTYEAEDLNKNKASCQFYIVVKDKQKPTVDRCFSPLPIVSPEPYAEVTWDEPEFSDNSEEDVRIQRSHAPGLFPKGKSDVVYTAFDASGNNVTCTLKINVIPHPCEYPPVPLNGNRSCHETSEGVVCKFFCKSGHRFAIQPAEEYLCAYDNVWTPQEKMPVSDCSALQLSKKIEQPASFTFTGQIACRYRPGLVRLEKNFEHRVGKRIDQLCQVGLICGISDMETTCTQLGDTSIHVILGRDKRSLTAEKVVNRQRRAAALNETITETVPIGEDAAVTFTYKLTGTIDPKSEIPPEKTSQEQEKLISSVEDIATALKKDAKTGDFDLNVNGKQLSLVNISLDNSLVFNCEPGSVRLDNACADCPVGTFFNVVSLKCESCGKGTFQPREGQLSCLVCPSNTSTILEQSVSEANCTALCLPGSFSDNGLEMCETCKRGYFQSQYGQTSCKRCRRRFTTRKRGSRKPTDCKAKCRAGYVSKSGVEPCWPCPRGSYQPRIGKSSCILCPGKANTPTSAALNVSQCELELSDSPQQTDPFDLFGQEQDEISVTDCFSEPCMNRATCKSKQFLLFECICVDGYKGFVCEEEINECETKPCQNGGSCIDLLADYRCICPPGFSDKKCETNIDDCKPDSCLNGGTCKDEVQGISCSCPNGFDGSSCEVNINDCKTDSCLNGGTCADEIAGYTCTCPVGIRGDNCEIDDDDCASGPCQNNANCVDGVGSFKCECPVGFSGKTCDIDIDDCAVDPCSLDARCEDLPGGYKCHCPIGYTGVSCKEVIDMYFQLDFPSTATTMDYAKVKVDKDLTAATVCFWMQTTDTENQGTPFSYATTDGDNVFTLSDYEGFVLYVNGDKITTTLKANDGNWHQICVVWSSNRGAWKIYLDGLPEDSGRNLASGQTIKGGGELVIGQEQDVVGGDFSKPEMFIGKLTQLNMWSRQLTLNDIENLRVSCDELLGDVVGWTDIAGKVHGSVSETTTEFCKECPNPRDIEYGAVTYTGVTAGSTALYTCNRGYNIAGKSDQVCLVNGEWDNREPSCAKVQCRYPGAVEHGWIEGSVYTFDNRIRYHCDRGYTLEGTTTRYCGELGIWIGQEPKCERIKCKIDVLSENTVLTNPTADHKFLPGADALFECKAGHRFYTTHTSVYCQRDGTWDQSIPTCDPQKCKMPPGINDGYFHNPTQAEEFTVGHIAQFMCDFGYTISTNTLNPSGKITCLPSGGWENTLPECTLVDCKQPTAIANGKFELDGGTLFLDTVTYWCNDGYELTFDDIIECLETGEWSPAPPECKPVICGPPDDVLHGFHTGSEYTYTNVVTYQCDLGYKIVGYDKRECLANESWSGVLPACKPVSCGKPKAIEYGNIIGRDYTLNNLIRYTCNAGFKLDGSEERVCRETEKWSNEAPVCVRIECVTPPIVDHGYYSETSFKFESTITYKCEEGYTLKGDAVIACQSSGLWYPAPPVCLELKCSTPPSIPNGFFLNPHGLTSFKISHTIQYQCNVGFEISINSLNPSGQVDCLATGQWEANFPECSHIQCRKPSPISNGYYNVQSRNYQGTVTYGCNEGYKINGDATLTCKSDGTWIGVQPWCTANLCEAIVFFRNGRVSYKDLTPNSVTRYTCNEGYIREGLEVRRCLNNLTWSGEEPACRAVSCGPPENIPNGTKQADGETFQSTVTYNCNYGYLLAGDRTRSCSKDGVWSGAVPVCEIVHCDKPSVVTSNGRMVGDTFTFGSVIEYVCDAGYYIDGPLNKRKCLASGQWDTPIPVCVAVECPRLSVRNGFTSGFQTEYGTTHIITCKTGYRLDGASERTCQQDGSWSGKESICVKYACGRLEPPVNGQVFIQGLAATYICLEGFTLNGPPTRTCQADDTWSGADPTCDGIMCEDITQIPFDNGDLTVEGLVYGSSIVYECKTGYSLRGDRKLVCQADGKWDGNVPFCEIKKCFEPYQPFNSRKIGEIYTFGSVVRFECDEGYLMTGIAERTCQADGSWSGKAITCDYIVCPNPTLGQVRNIIISGTSYTYDSTIEISCHSGYKLIGPPTRVCTATGQWSGDEPRCERSECPVPLSPNNGRVIASSYTQGSRIRYQCNEGYRLPGLNFRLCLSTLQWSGSDPTCIKVSCGTPPPLDNGYVTGDDLDYEGTVEYWCNEGYNLVGENRRRCLSAGRWGGADPSCIRVSCEAPTLPKHAVYSLPDGADTGSYEMTADLSCEKGYVGIGTNFQFCQANGKWSEANFQCEIVTCEEYPGLKNGRFTGLGSAFGDAIEIQCDDGYSLRGKSQGRCSDSGQWEFEVEPFCDEVVCPELPLFTNGKFNYEGSSQSVGQTVVYNCDEGYRLHGDSRRYCQKDGKWSGADPYCRLIICGNPPFVTNAIPFDSTTQYFFKSEARYICNKGYAISRGDSVLSCSQKGTWAGSIPICSVIKCGIPEQIYHGRIDVGSYDFGSEADYECDLGYRIKGTPTIQCDENGQWTGTLPTCVPISCGDPPDVANSVLIGSEEYTYNSQVTYICNEGYKLIGQQTSTCLATGIWSGTKPVCQPISCGPPPEIDFTNVVGSNYEYKSTVVYSCFYGYEMTGDPTLTCLYTGEWSPNRPICHQISCGPPPVLAHSSTTISGSNAVGSVVTYECNDGYYLAGSASAFCTPDRYWEYDSTVPSCLEKDCGKPADVDNGQVSYTLTTFQAEASYQCAEGYFIKGQSIRLCDKTGQWSGAVPFCEPVNCGRPLLNDNVQLIGTRFLYGDVVEYECDAGYTLSGDQRHECLADGFWSGEFPLCYRNRCKLLSHPSHSILVTPSADGSFYSGDVIEFRCEEGYVMRGKAHIECLGTERWGSDLPTCVIDPALARCPEHTGITNVRDLDSPHPVGAIVDLTCNLGFTTNAVLQSTCQGDQSWTEPAGQCTRISCGKPVLRDFVNVVRIRGGSYLYEDQIKFRCRAGVMPARSPPVITCMADGYWDGDIRCGVTCKQPCQNGGICLGLNRCKCPGGYGGRLCQRAICVLPCLNGGKCIQPFKCSCPVGYGDVRCNKAICQKPCQNGGKCVRPNRCKCAHGFKGAFCDIKRV